MDEIVGALLGLGVLLIAIAMHVVVVAAPFVLVAYVVKQLFF